MIIINREIIERESYKKKKVRNSKYLLLYKRDYLIYY